MNIDNCGVGMRCENEPGTFRCIREVSCGTGYTYDVHRKECRGMCSARSTVSLRFRQAMGTGQKTKSRVYQRASFAPMMMRDQNDTHD